MSTLLLPHPLLGKLTVREFGYFTHYHTEHHFKNIQKAKNHKPTTLENTNQKLQTMKKMIFKNGIIGGIIVSIVMIAMTYFMKTHPNEEPNPIIGFISMLLAFITVIVGIKRERLHNNGTISFGKAFRIGLGISLVIATIYVLVWLVIYYNFFQTLWNNIAKWY